MSFWQAQEQSRKKSKLCIFLFFLITVTAGFLLELAVRKSFRHTYNEQLPIVFIAFSGITLLFASYYFLRLRFIGGAAIAKTLGAHEVRPDTDDFNEKQLLNVIDEIKISANLPFRPKVFVLEVQEINAFSAGVLIKKSAITVTRGALEKLSRDELQGVIAHEAGHIINRDMRLNSQLGALLYGLTFITLFGLRFLRFCAYKKPGKSKPSMRASLYLAALLVIGIGGIAWCMARVIQSCLSREREMLADASAVQFTRSHFGLVNALRQIEHDNIKDMPTAGTPFAHLYFQKNKSRFDAILASHPPIYKRIIAIENMVFQNIEPEK
jgi:heat shock protein HtpX